jgi:hypothetical protein
MYNEYILIKELMGKKGSEIVPKQYRSDYLSNEG